MKFTVNTTRLIDALRKAKPVCNGRGIPILGAVCIEAKEKLLYITASNLDTRITQKIPASTKETGLIALDCSRLLAVVGSVRAEDTTFDLQENFVCKVSGGSVKAKLHGFNPQEFPEGIDSSEVLGFFSMKGVVLKVILGRVACAAATPAIARPNLEGVHFIARNEKATMEAGDGRIVHILDSGVASTGSINATVPTPAIGVLSNLLGETDVEVTFTRNHMIATSADFKMWATLINDEYVNTLQVIPKEYGPVINAPKPELLAAIGCADLLTNDLRRIDITSDKDGISIQSSQPEVGDIEARIDAKQAEPANFAAGARYLKTAISAIEGDNVSIELTGPRSAIAFRENNFIALVWPMISQN